MQFSYFIFQPGAEVHSDRKKEFARIWWAFPKNGHEQFYEMTCESLRGRMGEGGEGIERDEGF